MKFRRINRGLALGAVLIAATAAYVVNSNVQFKKHKPDIEETVKTYISDLCAANVEASQKKDSAPLESLIEKYWCGGDPITGDYSYYDFKSKSDTLNILSDYSNVNDGEFEKIESYVSDISAAKYGAKGAIVTVSFSQSMEFSGNPNFYYDYCSKVGDLLDNEISSDYDGDYNASINFYQCTLIMNLVDGEWKITNYSSGGWDSSVVKSDTEKEAQTDGE
jgi:hypothetical protein